MWMLRSWVPFMKKSGKNHGYPLSYQGFFTAAAPNYEGWWPVDPPGRKKTLLSVGWILKKLQVGRMIPGDLTQIHHEFNEFFCAGFNNRHDLFMFIFYIFSSHFFHLSFLYGKMWPQCMVRDLPDKWNTCSGTFLSEWRLSQRSWIWSSA